MVIASLLEITRLVNDTSQRYVEVGAESDGLISDKFL